MDKDKKLWMRISFEVLGDELLRNERVLYTDLKTILLYEEGLQKLDIGLTEEQKKKLGIR